MLRVPNCESAVLDIRKLEYYCLNAMHPRGRHKARLFRAALGIDQEQAGWLRDALLDGIRHSAAVLGGYDPYGTRWRVDVRVARLEAAAVIRTIWILRTA